MTKHNPLQGYTVRLSKHAQKAFNQLDNQLQERILEKLTQLTESSHHLDIKKMEGFKNFYHIYIFQQNHKWPKPHSSYNLHRLR